MCTPSTLSWVFGHKTHLKQTYRAKSGQILWEENPRKGRVSWFNHQLANMEKSSTKSSVYYVYRSQFLDQNFGAAGSLDKSITKSCALGGVQHRKSMENPDFWMSRDGSEDRR